MADGVEKKRAGKSAAKPARKKGGVRVNANTSSVRRAPDTKLNKELRDFKLIIDSSPIIIFYKDLEGRFLRVNRTFARALNMSAGDFIGKTNFDLYSLPMAQAMKEDDQEVIKSGRPKLNIVEQYESARGVRWVQTDKVPILDENGAVIGLLGFAQDITERKMAEKDLQLSEARYRTLVEKAFEGIIVIQDGNIVFANPRAYEIINYPRDRTEPRPFMDFIQEEDRGTVIDRHLRRLKGEQLEEVYPIRLIDRQGNIKWAQISTTLIDWEGKPATLTFLADISERKRAEEALQGSEKRVKMKLDTILSPQGDIGKLELQDILDIQAIQAIMDDFYKLTSVSAWILDLKGNVLISTGWQDICTQFHRANPETCKNCIESDTQLSEGVTPGTFKTYKCKNNMWDLVTPITVGEKHVGNLFLGQFLFDDETLDYELFRSQARRYGFNEAEYIAALERVPRWSRETVKLSTDFYSKFAHMISTLSYGNIALARSLTEKNNLLTALQASEAQYRLLSDHMTDTVWLMDMNLKTTYQSPSVQRVLGFTPEEINSMSLEENLTPASLKIATTVFLEEMAKIEANPNYNFTRILELEFYCKDGTTLWSENTFSLIRDANGKPQSILGEGRDITDRKLTEIALKESEEKYRTLFNEAPLGIAVTTLEGKVIELNEAQARMMGYTVEELRGKNAIEYYVNPNQRTAMMENFQKYGKLRDIEVELRSKDGSIITEILNFDLVQISGSSFMFITGRDVTGLRQAEKSMRASEAQYRLLAEHTTDFIVLMDMNLNPTYQSPSAEKHTGLTHKELMELPIEKRIAPESLRVASEMFVEEIPKIMADPNYNPIRTLELEIYRADGTTLWSENTFSVIRDENRNPISILGEARDITKRREAEKKLAQTLSALEKTLADTVIAISKMVEMKDPFTAGHQIRVAQLAIAIANKMNLADEQITLINTAATIHDIGKIYVPSDILSKPGKLSALEYEIIQTHVRGSYEILKEIDFIGPIAQIVFQHHERMDGSGYPRALKGPDILPEAKILIVADVVEAMSSHRPYRAAMGIEKALDEISRNRGKLYDEAAVDACLELFLNNEFSFKSV